MTTSTTKSILFFNSFLSKRRKKKKGFALNVTVEEDKNKNEKTLSVHSEIWISLSLSILQNGKPRSPESEPEPPDPRAVPPSITIRGAVPNSGRHGSRFGSHFGSFIRRPRGIRGRLVLQLHGHG